MEKTKKDIGISMKVNSKLKDKADHVFESLGLNTHAGINLMLKQMALRSSIPFEVNLTQSISHIKCTDDKSIQMNIKSTEEIKNQCTEIASSSGLNLTLVITMYLIQVIDKQAIPFKILSGMERE